MTSATLPIRLEPESLFQVPDSMGQAGAVSVARVLPFSLSLSVVCDCLQAQPHLVIPMLFISQGMRN